MIASTLRSVAVPCSNPTACCLARHGTAGRFFRDCPAAPRAPTRPPSVGGELGLSSHAVYAYRRASAPHDLLPPRVLLCPRCAQYSASRQEASGHPAPL